MHISGFFAGCPRSSIPKYNLLLKSFSLMAEESRCTFRILARCSSIRNSKIQFLNLKKSLGLKAEESRCTYFRILARCPRSPISEYKLRFQSVALKAEESRSTSKYKRLFKSLGLEAEGIRCTFQDVGQVSQVSHFPNANYVSKAQALRLKGPGAQFRVLVRRPRFSYSNTNSSSKAEFSRLVNPNAHIS